MYYGYGNVPGVQEGVLVPAVASIGFNPHYGNEAKTLEVHLLHEFADDFYGEVLNVLLTGFIRRMEKYDSLEALIAAIESDKAYALARVEDDKEAGVYDRVAANPLFASAALDHDWDGTWALSADHDFAFAAHVPPDPSEQATTSSAQDGAQDGAQDSAQDGI